MRDTPAVIDPGGIGGADERAYHRPEPVPEPDRCFHVLHHDLAAARLRRVSCAVTKLLFALLCDCGP